MTKRKTPSRRPAAPKTSADSVAPATNPQPVAAAAQLVEVAAAASSRSSATNKAPEATGSALVPVVEPARKFSESDRRRMIAQLAFSYAERARFQSDPFRDWLAAEHEVDARLAVAN